MAGSTTAWVDEMIRRAILAGASDIHFEPQESCLRVRYRIHGRLWEVVKTGADRASSVSIRIKAMAKLDIAEKRLPQDGSYRFRLGEEVFDLRISTLPVLYGEKIVVRILGNPMQHPHLGELGMSDDQVGVFRRFLQRPYGLIVAGGATGTGKSTTLYAALAELNTQERNVVAIEDPIEYRAEGVNQVQVGEKAGLTFAAGLRSVLRQDPDVIMVGELRDRETAEIAVRAALTGHLVLCTLHANTAAAVPLRFLEMGIEPYLLASSLTLVFAQRLVRLLCPRCAAVWPGGSLAQVKRADATLRVRGGCEHCHETGYSGRTGIFEFLPISEDIRSLLVAKDGWAVLRSRCRKEVQKPLAGQMWDLAAAGRMDVREALQWENDEPM